MHSAFKLAPANYSLANEFSLVGLDPKFTIAGFAPGHPAAPPLKPYVFQRSLLKDVVAFWESGLNSLKIFGDPGTGKSSLPEQFHARLRWPLYKVSCSPSTEMYHLMGQYLPMAEGGMRWSDGPVTRAAREGTSVLLDEYNVLDPGQATGLNLLLDGYSITIPETGEVLTPQPGFRVFATENPVTSNLAVAGRNVQDVANDDRWMNMEVDYLPADLEIQAVTEMLLGQGTDPDAAKMLARVTVEVANKVRAAYRGGNATVDKPMTTRSVMRWAKLVRRFQNVTPAEGGPVLYALRRGFLMAPDMRLTVEEFCRAYI